MMEAIEVLRTFNSQEIETYLDELERIREAVRELQPGDIVSVTAKNTLYSGTVMPNHANTFLEGFYLEPGAYSTYWDGAHFFWKIEKVILTKHISQITNYGSNE